MKMAVRVAFVLAVLAGVAMAGDEKLASLRFVVLRDYNGKPVRNASVVMHPVKADGRQARNGLQLKTDAEGKASFDGVPYGKLRIQVLAPGFQTFGEDYQINQRDMEIMIKVKRPTEQYSIYGDNAKKDESKKKEETRKDDKKSE